MEGRQKMRKKNQKQMPLMPCDIEHRRAKDLDQASQILDSIPNGMRDVHKKLNNSS